MTLQEAELIGLQSKIDSIKWFMGEGYSKDDAVLAAGAQNYGPKFMAFIDEAVL